VVCQMPCACECGNSPMSTLEELLEKSRQELLDLSTRNRLLSIPVGSKSARIIEVHDELSSEVYRLLVSEQKILSFLPGRTPGAMNRDVAPDENEEDVGLPQPDDEEDPKGRPAKRHIDCRLQTMLTPERLQRRLLDLYQNARTMVEEQGVNILYLVLGHLKWLDGEERDAHRHAPLILIPVELCRKSAADRFALKWTGDDIEENLTLRARLEADFGIAMPPFPEERSCSSLKNLRRSRW
jgi:hypothetical protein